MVAGGGTERGGSGDGIRTGVWRRGREKERGEYMATGMKSEKKIRVGRYLYEKKKLI
jgi:hypothetical protein